MDNNEQIRRILIASIISFVFFIAYDYFILAPGQKAQIIKQNTTTKITKKETSNIKQNIKNSNLQNIVTVKAKNFEIKIDNLGRISSYKLIQSRFNTNGKHLELINDSAIKPLEVRFEDEKLNKLAFFTPIKANKKEIILNSSPKSVKLTQKIGDNLLIKYITFYPDGHYDIKISLQKPAVFYISTGYRPKVAIDQLTIHGLVVKKSNDTLKIIEDGDAKNETIDNAVFAAAFDRYYTTLLFSKKPISVVVVADNEENPTAFIKSNSNINLTGYIGPKFVDTLKSINPQLVDALQYGVGTFFAKNLFFLLDWFYEFAGNWGVAIILLVVLVRVVLFPLTFKGMVSMYKLKELAPKMKEIQQKYKKDPQKLQMHMIKLYKEHGANPLGGCLPLLLQIPIFYGIYKLLLYAIELKGASFLWINDLSVMDPYFILPILMGVSMYIHQKLTPTNFQDPMQEKVFKFLPVVFTIMMVSFPAGLVLYWTVNNILSITQQWIINKTMTKG